MTNGLPSAYNAINRITKKGGVLLAWVADGFEIVFDLRDSSNRSFRKVFTTNASVTTPAEALTAAQGMLTSIGAIFDTLPKYYRVTQIYKNDAFVLPTGGVSGSDQAQLVCNIEGELKTVNLFIPGPDSGIFVSTSGPNRDVIDTADADLGTFLNRFKTTGGVFSVSDGEQLDDDHVILRGERIYRSFNPR